jgi:4-phytase / acid phosphatase
MIRLAAARLALLLGLPAALCAIAFVCPAAHAQSDPQNADLQFVVMLSRHGVRAPLTAQADLDKFSAAPWPKWPVAPGIQTTHGNEVIRLFGVWDRARWSGEGLFAPTGCDDAAHVTIVADTDQRTRETGKSLAEGIFPGCGVATHAQPEGSVDPLFRSLNAGFLHPDAALAAAAVEGRVGENPQALTEVYRPQLAALDRVLAGCGKLPANPNRISLFDIPVALKAGNGDSLISARSPLTIGATYAENLLLEYTQGMSDADTGWGCLDGATLRYVMQLDTAQWDYGSRTPAIARMNASNLLDHIAKTLQQGASGKSVTGALGKLGDKLVILVGHDSNIAAVAGALRLDWVLDGRVDDTPPGGALLFELWRPRGGGAPYVRVEYTAQTLEQMRRTEPLSAANPPGIAPIFVPGCSRQDLSCTVEGFADTLHQAIDPTYVIPAP